MSEAQIRRRGTTTTTELLDQLSALEPHNLRSDGIVTLASMLELERHDGRTLLDIMREEEDAAPPDAEEETAVRVSLMTLLALSDGAAAEEEAAAVAAAVADERMACCVCMTRMKGAAFISCGHTFCRVCSRELWTGRGRCPLCNALILDVLDIF